jgi:hypothetical protein
MEETTFIKAQKKSVASSCVKGKDELPSDDFYSGLRIGKIHVPSRLSGKEKG